MKKNLNMDKLKERLERLKNPGASRRNKNLWKPTLGEESLVRLYHYPYSNDPKDPFVELHFHYNVGTGPGSSFLCLRMNEGKSCPACDFAFKLVKSEDERDKAQAKDLFPKPRIFAAMVDRADEVLTPRLWGFSTKVYESLYESLNDEDECGYLDLSEGLDLRIKYTKGSKDLYPSTKLKFTKKESPLAETPQEVQKILDQTPTIESVFGSLDLTKSQIQEQLNNWLNFDESDAEEASTEVVKGPSASSTTDDDDDDDFGGSTYEDVEEAFKRV